MQNGSNCVAVETANSAVRSEPFAPDADVVPQPPGYVPKAPQPPPISHVTNAWASPGGDAVEECPPTLDLSDEEHLAVLPSEPGNGRGQGPGVSFVTFDAEHPEARPVQDPDRSCKKHRASLIDMRHRTAKSGMHEGDLKYVDELLPEDVGFSFCIRASADFSSEGDPLSARKRWEEGDLKHLYGLENMLAERADEATEQAKRDRNYGLQRAVSRIGGFDTTHRNKKMPFTATSTFCATTKLILMISAVMSCMFVIGFCAVEPACEHGSVPELVWAHLANSIIYGLVAIPSRGLFSVVDWRIGEEIKLPLEVFMSHLKRPGLYLDILSLGGLMAEIAFHVESAEHGPLPTVAQWLMLMQLFKSWRVVLSEDSQFNRSFWQGIGRLLLYLLAFAHVVGCCFLLVGNFEKNEGTPSWLDNPPYRHLDMRDCVVRYTEAFYFSVIGLTSVGYGDLMVTSLEHNLNAFFLLTSQLFAAGVCAQLTWLTSMYNQHESDIHERRRSLVLALDKMGVPEVLVKRVLAFQRYENTMHADNMDKETFNGLGKNLMEELRLCTYRKLVLQAPFLREQPREVISFIVNALLDFVYLPADLIVRAGEHGRELFFVRRGEARAYLGPHSPVWGQSVSVATMKAGSYFGELAMLTGLPRGSYVMATSYCICSVLPYSAVEDLVEMHPEAFTTLVQTMVNLYSLKPEWTWKELTFRLGKKFGLENDEDAFIWFRSHAETAEVQDLHAKAFDLALQRLKVPHLDRRIFWSELDKDASGGISYEEFRGKLNFATDGDDICGVGSLEPTPYGSMLSDLHPVMSSSATSACAFAKEKGERDWQLARSSSPPGELRFPSKTEQPHIYKRNSAFSHTSSHSHSTTGTLQQFSLDTDASTLPHEHHAEKTFALLLEQNQLLLQEINRNLHLIKPSASS